MSERGGMRERESESVSRGAACEKIFSWHSASADDEINSVRGCGSAVSTGHTSRFERIERTEPQNREEETRIRGSESETIRDRRGQTGGSEGEEEEGRGNTPVLRRRGERVLTHVLSASTTF